MKLGATVSSAYFTGSPTATVHFIGPDLEAARAAALEHGLRLYRQTITVEVVEIPAQRCVPAIPLERVRS